MDMNVRAGILFLKARKFLINVAVIRETIIPRKEFPLKILTRLFAFIKKALTDDRTY